MPSRLRVGCSLSLWAVAASPETYGQSATIIRPTWTDRVTPILDSESRKKFRRNLLAEPAARDGFILARAHQGSGRGDSSWDRIVARSSNHPHAMVFAVTDEYHSVRRSEERRVGKECSSR